MNLFGSSLLLCLSFYLEICSCRTLRQLLKISRPWVSTVESFKLATTVAFSKLVRSRVDICVCFVLAGLLLTSVSKSLFNAGVLVTCYWKSSKAFFFFLMQTWAAFVKDYWKVKSSVLVSCILYVTLFMLIV